MRSHELVGRELIVFVEECSDQKIGPYIRRGVQPPTVQLPQLSNKRDMKEGSGRRRFFIELSENKENSENLIRSTIYL
jgi:hypothetical protein